MRKILNILIILTLFSFSVMATDSYNLKFKFKPGQVIKYAMVMSGKVATKVAPKSGEAKEDKGSFRINMLLKGEVTKVMNRGRKFEILYSILKGQQVVNNGVPQPLTYGDVKVYVTMDNKGRVLGTLSNSPQFSNIGSSSLSLPEKPVKVGDSWKAELSGKNNPVPTIGLFKLVKVYKNKRGHKIAVIKVKTYSKKVPGMHLKATATGTLYFDIDDGIITKSVVRSKAHVKYFDKNADATVEQSVNSSVKMELIR